jgi:hypothetical protein
MNSIMLVIVACLVLSSVGAKAYPNLGKSRADEVQTPDAVNKAQEPNYSVKVTKVIERTTPENRVVYQISYDYEFKGRTTVYVKGIGVVPAKGQFSYMTSEAQLEFRESMTGPVITTVQLEETIRTQGSDSTEFPEESKFPNFFRSGTWTQPATFPIATVKVIQKYFPSGYTARQTGQVNSFITTYRNLQVPNPNNDVNITNLRSQIALVVSQPYDPSGNGFTYRIQFVARDRPRLSTTWRYGDERNGATITAAQVFVDAVIAELETSVRTPQ